MKKIAAFTVAAGVLAGTAFGKVSFSLDIEALLSGDGASTISDSGLLVLVVDKSGTGNFAMPTAGSIASGETDVVATWDLSDYDFENPGIQLVTPDQGVTYEADWNAGDPLALFWFPTLTKDNMVPAADTAFGVFADAFNLASGHSWMMPADGAIAHSLKFFTAAAEHLVDFGDFPEGAGVTAFAVDQLPGTIGMPDIEVVNGGGKSTISWAASEAVAGGYVIRRKVEDGSWETIGFAEPGATSFVDMDVLAGISYEYQIFSQSGTILAQSDLPPAVTSERSIFKNLSTKGYINSTSGVPTWQTLVAGVRVAGEDPSKRFLIQGFGPRGGSSYIEDPLLALEWHNPANFAETRIDGLSDNWMEDPDNPAAPNPDALAIEDLIEGVGAQSFEIGSADAALAVDLDINTSYIAALTSNNAEDDGQTRIGLFDGEFDPATSHNNRIVNLSTKGFLSDEAGTEFNGGVVIRGNVPKEVLVVASGPELAATNNPADLLEDPMLELRAVVNGVGVPLATNDNWDQVSTATPEGAANGLVALETDVERVKQAMRSMNFKIDAEMEDGSSRFSLDSAMLVTLNPGVYVFEVMPKPESRAFGTVKIGINEIEMP